MKKFVFSVLCLILFVSVALLAIGCNQSHTHSFTEQTVKDEYLSTAASCTDKAKYFYSCSCGEKGTETFEYGSPLGHEFTSYISDNNATCTQDGTKTAKCDRCDVTDTITDGGSVKGHTVVIDEAKAATCTESGLTEGKHCSVCNAVLEEQDVIPAKGHTYSAEWSYNETEHWHAATCGHNVKKDTIKHSFDENKKCTVCDYVTTKPLGIELQSSVFDINLIKKTGYIKVSNSIADYDFSDKFIVADGAGFDVYTDKQCNNKVASKNVNIVAGDNVFYVLVTNDGDTAIYTLTIRRKPIYTVSFDTNGGSTIQSQQVEEDGFAVKPETSPTRPGYTFSGWNFDFTTPITEDKTVSAIYTIRQYKINVASSVSDICKLSGDGDYDYDSTVSLSISNVYLGYEFCGWYNGDTLLSVDYDYTFNMPADDITITARLAVKQEMQIYNFTSITSTCEIDSIKDTTATNIVIPEYVTSIKYNVFEECVDLKSVIWNAKYCEIKSPYPYSTAVFGNCEKLTNVTIGNKVKTIPCGAFSECSGLTDITIPDNVNSIAAEVFKNCSGLTTITIPDSVSSLGDYAFYDCSGLTSVIIGNGVTAIGSSTFKGCGKLASVTIGNKVTSIGRNAFYECIGLTNIVIPDCVTTLGDSAFYGCSELTSVTLGNGVTSIISSFLECSKLTDIYITDLGVWCRIPELSGVMGVNGESKRLYLNGKLITDLVIPDGITSINDYAFNGCIWITSIEIPDSVTAIGAYAFSGCIWITSIKIPDNVTSIGHGAFNKCSGLSSITIPDSVTILDGSAFYGCSGLTSITIGNGITSIGNFAFKGCLKLANIYIADITSWCNIDGLANLMYYSRNKNLYLNNKLITDLVIPDSVTAIKEYAICGCSGLTSITIPNSVTSIGEYAFYNCSGLTSITIPGSVTSIGDGVFADCSGLTSITIGSNVTSIADYAFSGCGGLKEIHFKGSKTQWNAIKKSNNWNDDTGNYVIICIDGTISK